MKNNVLLCSDKSGSYYLFKPDVLPANEVKQIGGRWNAREQAWRLPESVAAIEGLYRLFDNDEVRLSPKVREVYNQPFGFVPTSTLEEVISKLPEAILSKLYPYQINAVWYLTATPNKAALLNLSPRLGKTVVSLLAAKVMELANVLIITQKSLRPNWVQEALTWADTKVTILHQEAPPKTPGWFVTNYETITRKAKEFSATKWDALIVDESILIQNPSAKRTIALSEVRKNSTHVWELSGYPVSKHADDLYAQLQLLRPNVFTSYWRFVNTYCEVEKTRWGDKVVGTKRRIKLPKEFRDIMLVVNRRDVLSDLPEIRFQTMLTEFDGTQAELYTMMYDEFLAVLDSGEELTAVNKVSQLIRLQQIASNPTNLGEEWPDLSAKRDVLLTLLETDAIELPAIIWVHWKRGATALYNTLNKAGLNVSRVKTGEDTNVFEAFKRNETDIMIVPLAVGKFGHTLSNAATAIYYDRTWSSDDFNQSLERIQHVQQKRSPVVITLKAPNTVDELVEAILMGNARSIANATNSDLATMLRSIRNAE
jgi:SNF2 family DNA or RNA helicase